MEIEKDKLTTVSGILLAIFLIFCAISSLGFLVKGC